jgi:hypothetical protein
VNQGEKKTYKKKEKKQKKPVERVSPTRLQSATSATTAVHYLPSATFLIVLPLCNHEYMYVFYMELCSNATYDYLLICQLILNTNV